jgi:hypothetical protein
MNRFKRTTLAAALGLLLTLNPAFAAPGAHGPNGEHLDAPVASGTAQTQPRIEARTDSFELVATLYAGELSVLIDRYATNEPVLRASLEVESGGLKAKATFHADQGDYAVDDAKLLALLRQPGEHALVFTLVASGESDLLDGTLKTTAGATAAGGHGHAHDDHSHDDHGHDHALERAAWTTGGLLALGLLGAVLWRRQRNASAQQKEAL